MAKGKSSMNLEENVAGLVCYLGLWVTGIIFFLMEKENKTVRFHAMQSIIAFIPLNIIGYLCWYIGKPKWGGYYGGVYGWNIDPGIPALMWLSYIIFAITGLLCLILMFKAYQGEKFKLPVIGDIAEKHA